MATKTRVDLANSAMREIKKLANGEELAPEDQTFVLEKIDAAHEELAEREIVYWDIEQIPEAQMTAYTRVIAADIAGRYTDPIEARIWRSERRFNELEMLRLTTRQNPPEADEEKFF